MFCKLFFCSRKTDHPSELYDVTPTEINKSRTPSSDLAFTKWSDSSVKDLVNNSISQITKQEGERERHKGALEGVLFSLQEMQTIVHEEKRCLIFTFSACGNGSYASE